MSSPRSKTVRVPSQFSAVRAHRAQLETSKKIVRKDRLPEKLCYVAGIDVAYTEQLSIAAAVVLDYDSISLVESKTVKVQTRFPYVPTLLSFREIPPAVAVVEKLQLQPDVFLVDGQGIMHPYRLGFASHLGLVLNKPTIGVAKNPLVGKIGEFGNNGWAQITDGQDVIGAALIPRRGVKPVYVSIGHMISLEKAIEIVKHCTPTFRIPKPIRLAHNVASEEKHKLQAAR